MKIPLSVMIAFLQNLQAQHGNLDVEIMGEGGECLPACPPIIQRRDGVPAAVILSGGRPA